MIKGRTLLATLLFLGPLTLQAQDDAQGRKGKFFLVPEFWLSFGTVTYIEVAPLVGYHINDRLAVGLGPHYIYQSRKESPFFPAYQTHVFGVKGFARFALITHAEEYLPINLFNDLFVHVEYEGMSLESRIYDPNQGKDRFIYHAILVGGGLSQRIGLYNSISFMVLWDLNESSRSPYSNPVFRIGFNTYL
jgi:hypothetical protein